MSEMQASLEQGIAVSLERGAHRFDPARFKYIQSLARRCGALPRSVGRRMEQKALVALDGYTARYKAARKEAEAIVHRVSSDFPDAADKIRELLTTGDFKGVKRLSGKLSDSRRPRALAELTDLITHGRRAADEDADRLSLNEILRRQEAQILNDTLGKGPNIIQRKKQFRSFHLFKETWAKLYVNGLVADAIKDCPQDPGPLNGQMLATRSLSAMRRLSPGYLNRFVAYIDTLLWLQQTDRDIASRRAKR